MQLPNGTLSKTKRQCDCQNLSGTFIAGCISCAMRFQYVMAMTLFELAGVST
ncbi:hypothetical protein BLL52_3756 [Rhodoferax antarcticus ANT.BR]|uniref:Uncharacterized protein n=1 Tax=Rhodoferax antarcticus ANT.BR TaxID=1111071 RepID=A0A1Q8YA51_9BURK|nr:hypothetical protein BLL52_3756 [Rhodoferax antarcticus ANT.BR]